MPESHNSEKLSHLSTLESASGHPNSTQQSITSPEGVASPARRAVLSLSVAACGAAVLFLDQPTTAAVLQHPDAQILRFLEELEELQADFFTRSTVSSANAGLTSRDREILSIITRQDREHIGWLDQAHGKYRLPNEFYLPNTSQSRPPRSFNFPAPLFAERGRLLATAVHLKETAVSAYHGMVLKAEEPRLAQSIAALAGVEGRHAAALQTIGSGGIQPAASETPLSASQVMNRLHEFGFRGEALQ